MGRVGALSRPEPPVVCPECTLGRGGAALPAGLSSGVPGSPVHPTTQSAVGAGTLQGDPHPASPPHTHTATLPPRPSERQYKAAETTLPPLSKWPGKVS